MKKIIINKKTFISIGAMLFLAFTLVQCNKNSNSFIDESKLISRSINSNINANLFAKALSKALVFDKNLRDFIKNKSRYNDDGSFAWILLSCVRNENIDGERTFEDAILSHYYENESNIPKEKLYDNVLYAFPTFELKIPDRLYNIDWNTSDATKTPSVVYYNPDPITYFNGALSHNPKFLEESTIYFINLRLSESTLSVNTIDSTINNSTLLLKDLYGNISDSCKLAVNNHLDSISESCKRNQTHVLVSLRDIYKIINNCNDEISTTTTTTTSTSSDPLCLTDPIRDVDDDHYTYNYFEGLELLSEDALNYIDNQPGGEDVFTFAFIWANAKNGGMQSHDRRFIVNRNEIYEPPVYEWTETDDPFYCPEWDDYAPCGYYKLIEGGYPIHFSFPSTWGTHFFSYSDSRWDLDDVGKFFNLEIVEYDETTSSSTSGYSNTYSVSIEFTVPLFEKAGSLGWSFKNSFSVSHSTTITGSSIVPIGQDPIDWCDQEEQYLDYPWGSVLMY